MAKALYTTLSIRNGHAIVRPEYERSNKMYPCRAYNDNLEKGRIVNKSNGTLSPTAIKNLKNSINNLIATSTKKTLFSKKFNKKYHFRCSFLTLTLSDEQRHTDRQIYKLLLHPFLQWLRDSEKVVNYVWKAETQKNGRIHYHIIINKFIHYNKIREAWNRLQLQHGYLNNYYQIHQHFNAPSTEIKAIKKIKNITGYFIKYLAKNQKDRRLVTGKLWSASYNLLKRCTPLIIADKVSNEVNYLIDKLSYKYKEYDYFNLILFNSEQLLNFKSIIRDHWIDFITKISEPPDEYNLFTI